MEEFTAKLLAPARARLKFERELEQSAYGTGSGLDFRRAFEADLERYRLHVTNALRSSLEAEFPWLREEGVEMITWHYKTRHPPEGALEEGWLAAQLALVPSLEALVAGGALMPFKEGTPSPYIEIFAVKPSAAGAPIYILLPDKSDGDDVRHLAGPDWALVVPWRITAILLAYVAKQKAAFGERDAERIRNSSSTFFGSLKTWIATVGGGAVDDDAVALANLVESLKPTLIVLLKQGEKAAHLPRSVFLCPAYIGDERVGGMAFTCAGRVSLETAIIGGSVAASLLTYLRLHEDALAHMLVEEMDELDQAKRFFIHRLTHDFRHPLDALRSTVREVRGSLDSIDKQLGHVDDVMNQTLLALEGRDPKELLKPKKRPDKIREFIADILFYFRRQFVEKNKRLLAGEIDNSWTFNVDRGMLREVVENLVANALEHGGAETRLDVELQSGRVFIHVQDDGGGISDFDRARIFAPFYRKSILEQTRPLRGRGLALATLLMRTQGGGIYFKTSEGRYFRDDGEACDPLPFQPSEWSSDFVVEVGQE